MRLPRFRRKLFWRIYLNGLLLLLAVGVTVALVAVHGFPSSKMHPRAATVAPFLAAAVEPYLADRPALQAQLERMRVLLDADIAVYRADGTPFAWADTRPTDPLAPVLRLAPDAWASTQREGGAAVAVGLDGGFQIVAALDGPGHGVFFAIVALLLGAAALASIPLARAIARPLERLTGTARRLAAGDLQARTGVSRRDEVGTLATALDDMAERLTARIRRERELLANVSHELRTPLARLRVALELCDEDGTRETIRRHLAGIGQDVVELERLVDDILVTTRLEMAGEDLRLRRAPVSVADVIADAAERFRRQWPDRRLDTEPGEALPPFHADRELLRRVLDNLLENAVRHSEASNVVEVRARREGEAIRVEVADHGVGVAEEDLPRLFEPFFRTDRSRSRAEGGVGLGLTLCKRIVESHGGTIVAEPNPGGGLRVRLLVPAGPAS